MDIPQLALAVEDFLRPFARHAERLGEGTEKLDDLGNVIVVFSVLCARLRVEEVIAGDEFKDLARRVSNKVLTSQHKMTTHHGCHAPHVGAGAPFAAEYYFG